MSYQQRKLLMLIAQIVLDNIEVTKSKADASNWSDLQEQMIACEIE